MRLFLDTEFSAFREGELLSLGVVSDAGHEFYAELPDVARQQAHQLMDFHHEHVLAQFGRISCAAAPTLEELGSRFAAVLQELPGSLVLCFDYKLDERFTRQALVRAGNWHQLAARVTFENISSDVAHPECKRAQDAVWARELDGLKVHHALADARALRAQWVARPLSG